MDSVLTRALALQAELNALVADLQAKTPMKVRRFKKISKEGEAEIETKPKRILTPEHLAKLKAAREAAKARRQAEKEAAEAVAVAE
jgi:hypothetical protein